MRQLSVVLCLLALCQGAVFRDPTYKRASDFDRHIERVHKALGIQEDYVRYPCEPCPSGFGVEVECRGEQQTVCIRCQDGTFAGPFNHFDKCKPCSQCGTGLYAKTPCSINKDVECAACSETNPTINGDYINKCLTRDPSRDFDADGWLDDRSSSSSSSSEEHQKGPIDDNNDPWKAQRMVVEKAIEDKLTTINKKMPRSHLDDIFADSDEIKETIYPVWPIDEWLDERQSDKEVMKIVDQDYIEAKARDNEPISQEKDEWNNWWDDQATQQEGEIIYFGEQSDYYNRQSARADWRLRVVRAWNRVLTLLHTTRVLLFILCVMLVMTLCLCMCKTRARRCEPKTKVVLSPANLQRYNPLKSDEVPYGRLNEVESDAVRNSALAQVQTHRFNQSDDEYDDDEYLYQPVHTVVNPLSELEEPQEKKQ